MSLIPLSKKCIELDIGKKDKNEILEYLISLIDISGNVNDIKQFKKDIFDREKKITTGIGSGIAIPHAKSLGIDNFSIAFARSKKGLDFASMDNNPVYLFFILGAPVEHDDEYLKGMSELSGLLKDPEFRQALIDADSKDEIFDLITGGE